MEDEFNISLDGGKTLGNLRVVDLKQELEKRGLSKSGSKKDLVKRLKQQLEFEKLCEERKSTGDCDLKKELDARTEQNEFVQRYLAQQQKIFAEQKEMKRLVELEETQKKNEESLTSSQGDDESATEEDEDSEDNESSTTYQSIQEDKLKESKKVVIEDIQSKTSINILQNIEGSDPIKSDNIVDGKMTLSKTEVETLKSALPNSEIKNNKIVLIIKNKSHESNVYKSEITKVDSSNVQSNNTSKALTIEPFKLKSREVTDKILHITHESDRTEVIQAAELNKETSEVLNKEIEAKETNKSEDISVESPSSQTDCDKIVQMRDKTQEIVSDKVIGHESKQTTDGNKSTEKDENDALKIDHIFQKCDKLSEHLNDRHKIFEKEESETLRMGSCDDSEVNQIKIDRDSVKDSVVKSIMPKEMNKNVKIEDFTECSKELDKSIVNVPLNTTENKVLLPNKPVTSFPTVFPHKTNENVDSTSSSKTSVAGASLEKISNMESNVPYSLSEIHLPDSPNDMKTVKKEKLKPIKELISERSESSQTDSDGDDMQTNGGQSTIKTHKTSLNSEKYSSKKQDKSLKKDATCSDYFHEKEKSLKKDLAPASDYSNEQEKSLEKDSKSDSHYSNKEKSSKRESKSRSRFSSKEKSVEKDARSRSRQSSTEKSVEKDLKSGSRYSSKEKSVEKDLKSGSHYSSNEKSVERESKSGYRYSNKEKSVEKDSKSRSHYSNKKDKSLGKDSKSDSHYSIKKEKSLEKDSTSDNHNSNKEEKSVKRDSRYSRRTEKSPEKDSKSGSRFSERKEKSPEKDCKSDSHSLKKKDEIDEHNNEINSKENNENSKLRLNLTPSKEVSSSDSEKYSVNKQTVKGQHSQSSEKEYMSNDNSSSTDENSRSDDSRKKASKLRHSKKLLKRRKQRNSSSSSSSSSRSSHSENASDKASDGEIPDSPKICSSNKWKTSIPVSKENSIVDNKEPPPKKLKINRNNVVIPTATEEDIKDTYKRSIGNLKDKVAVISPDKSSFMEITKDSISPKRESSESTEREMGEIIENIPEVKYEPRKLNFPGRKLIRKSTEELGDEPKSKKSKWGKFASSQKSSQTINISTDSLKSWFPDFKLVAEPVSVNELMSEESPPVKEYKKLSFPMDAENNNNVFKQTVSNIKLEGNEEEPTTENTEPTGPVSKIVFIQNLVRPFTLLQLKELLKQTGTLIEEEFWIDKIKSKCFATYETVEDAIRTRNALNGTRWPASNPKILVAEFSNEEELENYRRGIEIAKIIPESVPQAPDNYDSQNHPPSSDHRRKDRESEKRRDRERYRPQAPVREWDKDKIKQESPERERDTDRKEKKGMLVILKVCKHI